MSGIVNEDEMAKRDGPLLRDLCAPPVSYTNTLHRCWHSPESVGMEVKNDVQLFRQRYDRLLDILAWSNGATARLRDSKP